MKQLTRRIARTIVTGSVLLGSLAVGSSAHAYLYDGSGVWGHNRPGSVSCMTHFDGLIRTETRPPLVYAFDRNRGGGNDRQTVRYRLFYVDAATGSTVASSGWSAWSVAVDNVPAQWSGATRVNLSDRRSYVVDVRIEFYNVSTGRYEGHTAHRTDSYNIYNGRIGPMPANLCRKATQ